MHLEVTKEMQQVYNYNELKYLVYSDLFRYTGKVNTHIFLYNMLRNPGFQYSFYMRLCSYFKSNRITKHTLKMIRLHTHNQNRIA